jgi:hypothetical protein
MNRYRQTAILIVIDVNRLLLDVVRLIEYSAKKEMAGIEMTKNITVNIAARGMSGL